MAKKDKEEVKERSDHGGSTAAEDQDLTLWLNRLWARNEPPERVELWQMFGRNKVVRGEMIHHEDFKAGTKLDIEQCNRLANEIMASAQNDCDSTRREAWYQLAIIDRNRKASPLVRRVGPLQPKRSYALKSLEQVDAESVEDDENALSIASLDLRRIKEANEQNRWDKQRVDRLTEGMLLLQHNIIQNQQTQLDKLMGQQFVFFEKMQEAEDRRVQRELVLEKEKLKLSLMRDGLRTARNLLPAIFGGGGGESVPAPQQQHQSNGGQPVPQNYGPSPERALVDNFLHDVEDLGEEIQIKLFGDFEMRDNKLAQKTPGIFTLGQYHVLIGVQNGAMPAAALDDLMPDSGHPLSISQVQVMQAIDAGVTEGTAMSILELVGLRKKAREAIAASQPQAATAS